MSLRVWLSGSIVLEGPAGRVHEPDLAGRQGRMALVALCLTRHRPMAHDALADRLWTGDRPQAWELSLRSTLSRLRSAVQRTGVDGRGVIASSFGCYQFLLPVASWVDIEAAADGVHKAEHAATSGDLPSAVAWARVTVAQTAAELLPNEHADWVIAERDRLTDLRVRALAVLSAAWIARNDAPLAVRDATEMLALRPFRDDCARALMNAHVAAGNPAEALRCFAAFRALLDRELGVLPDAETRDLHAAILSRV